MASSFSAGAAALVALAVCTAVGLPLGLRLIADRALVVALAPILGWAVFSAAALPVLCVIGFGPATVAMLAGGASALGLFALARMRKAADPKAAHPIRAGVPAIAYLVAALLAVAPPMALLPKETLDGVLLAAPIFDHSKIAIVDEIVRSGVPAPNPFYGEAGAPSGLAYYYLWHFAAAMLSLVPGVSGWEADVGLTWFTAFATLSLVMGLAVAVSGRKSAAFWALALSGTASARPLVSAVFGQDVFGTWLSDYPDLGSGLAQATWAPQHVAAAGCVLVALMLIARLSEKTDWLTPVALGLTAAAGFGSSVWVGGAVFALAALAVGLLAFLDSKGRRGRLVVRALLAGAAAIVAAAPILLEQARAAILRSDGLPITLHPYEVLGPSVVDAVRRPLDLVAFWVVQLPVDLPAIVPAGALALAAALRSSNASLNRRRLARTAAITTLASFGVAWLFVSTILNNDLGWRAILPGVLALMAFAAAGLSRWTSRPVKPAAALAAVALLVVGAYGGAVFLKEDATGRPSASAGAFARSPELWRAVRRLAGPTDRVASNPDLFGDVTRWPINISWALFADRRSCYAGWEFARPFAAATRAEVDRVDQEFRAAFDGAASVETVRRIFVRHQCRFAVVTASDGAWADGPFSRNPDFELLDEKMDSWRIYRFKPQAE